MTAPLQLRGRMITLEGVEGVGKTTHVGFVAERIRAMGKEVVVTREPGGVPAAERIRDLLLASDGPTLTPMTELLLMFAARSSHLEELIWPALHNGRWVVCDRFTDASYAYQGAGRGLRATHIASLEALVQQGFQPDLTLLFDAERNVTRHRREARGVSDRFEKEDEEFVERVRLAYLERARQEPDRFRVIDASRSVAEVRRSIEATLTDFFSISDVNK